MLTYRFAASVAPSSWPPLVVVIVSGAGGTAILRSYVISVGKGRGHQIGLVSPYDKLCSFADSQMASAAATTRTAWLRQRVEPTLSQVDSREILHDVMSYLEMCGTLKQTQLAKIRSGFEETLSRGTWDPHVRMDFYKEIVASGGYVQLRAKVKQVRGSSSQAPKATLDLD
jgi:hypothetical protein